MAFVTTEVQGAVAVVTIDRPKALNALNPEVLADLKAAFEGIDQNTVRCVVLTGAGDKSFVAGADIGSMSTMTKAEGEAFGKMGNDIFLMIESFPLPVIAAVNGFALGGGNELAMSCDIRICSDNAVFGWASPRALAAPSAWPVWWAWAWPSSWSTRLSTSRPTKPCASAWSMRSIRRPN